jgi:cyclopropane-fatty-acyl-phospholipid synthase
MSSRVKLAEAFDEMVGPDAGLRFEAYDGSTAGPEDAYATMEIRSPEAVRYIATARGDLGLARAFVSGELEVHGDLHAALQALVARGGHDVGVRQALGILRAMGPRVLHRPQPPAEEAGRPLMRGVRHSKRRDAAAIAHHYDVSNRFYEIVLGPSMTYTCAVYPTFNASLEDAQAEKYELVSRKLGLEPGMRLLDVGCGWGGMVMHAAEHHGVRAIGVTLSRRQAEWAQKAIAQRGLADRAEVRFMDYRDIPETGFDAVSSIGLTEHIGAKNVPAYVQSLHDKLRPEGRLLNHCITRPHGHDRAKAGGFIDRYVFPDGELESPGDLVTAIHDHGFEVRHEENLREHYAMTLRDWGENLEAGWDEAVEEVGVQRARVWRLYMAASRVGFDLNNIQLHQVLAVRLGDRGASGMPLRPTWGA